MLAAERYPAAEIVELYHQCWELETGFDELHTHTLERLEALRSQTPDRIQQKLFALAVVYNLVRLEMARVAGLLEVSRMWYLISVPQELGELLFWRVRRQNPVLVKREFLISLKT